MRVDVETTIMTMPVVVAAVKEIVVAGMVVAMVDMVEIQEIHVRAVVI